MTRWLAAIALAVLTGTAAQAQDAAEGQKAFRKCQACHMVGPGAKHKVGPILNGLDGRKAGTIEGFGNYSEANKNSGTVWNEESFIRYIRAPAQEMKGTKMAFGGIANEQERADLWAFLKQFNADGSKK